MTERQGQSRLGIASCLMAIGVWVYSAIAVLIAARTDAASQIGRLFATGQTGMVKGVGDFGLAVFIAGLVFIVIPVVGHLVGIVCGAAGAFSTTRKRIFAFLGVMLNAAPFLIGAVLFVIGSLVTK